MGHLEDLHLERTAMEEVMDVVEVDIEEATVVQALAGHRQASGGEESVHHPTMVLDEEDIVAEGGGLTRSKASLRPLSPATALRRTRMEDTGGEIPHPTCVSTTPTTCPWEAVNSSKTCHAISEALGELKTARGRTPMRWR